jgi:hypothetical protein
MTDLPDHSGLLEAARKQLKRKAPTPEQRARRRLSGQWSRNLEQVWGYADLLSDDELIWLAQITVATKDKPARISVNPWTGRRVETRRPTSADDAARLPALISDLYSRDSREEDRLHRDRRRKLAARMRGLGLKSPPEYGIRYGHRLGFWRDRDDEGGDA